MFFFGLFVDDFSLILGDDLLSKGLLDSEEFLLDSCCVGEIIFVVGGDDAFDSVAILDSFISVLCFGNLVSYRIVQCYDIFVNLFVFAQKFAVNSYQQKKYNDISQDTQKQYFCLCVFSSADVCHNMNYACSKVF